MSEEQFVVLSPLVSHLFVAGFGCAFGSSRARKRKYKKKVIRIKKVGRKIKQNKLVLS